MSSKPVVRTSPETPGVSARPRRPKPWMKTYQQRIDDGLEHCRVCSATSDLALCRVRYDRGWEFANSTILCAEHAGEYYSDFQPYTKRRLIVDWRWSLQSLAREEDARPGSQRWGRKAGQQAHKQWQEKYGSDETQEGDTVPDPIDPAAFEDPIQADEPRDGYNADRAADREERWLTRGWD